MDVQRIDLIIERLEAVRERPMMYLGELDRTRVTAFFHGFYLALGIYEKQTPGLDLLRSAYSAGGWNFNAMGPIPDMISKGLSPTEIVDEMISAQIDSWKLLLSEFNDGL